MFQVVPFPQVSEVCVGLMFVLHLGEVTCARVQGSEAALVCCPENSVLSGLNHTPN